MQYIGARYVTKIYENSGDPSSAEWEASVNYEPLTMVTYNNGSYLSKKAVPASAGDPPSEPDYWVQTGFYNGQIAFLQSQIDAINLTIGNVDDLDDYTAALTIAVNKLSFNDKHIDGTAPMTISGATLDGYDVASTSNPVIEMGTNAELKNSTVSGTDIAVHMNASGDNVRIVENDISGDAYGVLVNAANDGKNILVEGNSIYSRTGDAVEINTPRNDNDKDTHGIIVANNHLAADNNGSDPGSGFTVGVARGRDVVIVGNVGEISRAEAIHVEDNSRRVIVSNNIFKCRNNGTAISINYSKNNFTVNGLTNGGRPILVTNNIFEGPGSGNYYGLNIVSTATDDDAICNMTNNIVSGFRAGIVSSSSSNNVHARNFDGCVVTDCDYGMFINDTYNMGKVTFSDITNEIINATGLCHFDEVEILDYKNPADIIKLHASLPTQLTVSKLTANLTQNMVDGTPSLLFKIPSGMNGILTLEFYEGGNRSSYVMETDGSTLTNISVKAYGSESFNPSISGGYLQVSTFNISTIKPVICKLTFDGVLCYKN